MAVVGDLLALTALQSAVLPRRNAVPQGARPDAVLTPRTPVGNELDALRPQPVLDIPHRHVADGTVQAARGFEDCPSRVWEAAQASADLVELALCGDRNPARVSHCQFEFGLALQQGQGFGNGFHGEMLPIVPIARTGSVRLPVVQEVNQG